ncbi:Gp15 family bacteriophage protein [Floricoccus penangensis]|uniref:Gp15 family bacteriophage protein n=1 Tax=Floricoccus penangensis TaxID=1859475 RepID=UPI00203DABE6|nr:Gp15 family bacteriophage protein [Floricoccus penangensis]URZ87555.1 hypothetical protein KIW23_00455 [Floricoccus penangensis]
MKLNDPLVSNIIFFETEFSLDLSFDNVLDVLDIMNDCDLFIEEKVDICTELLVGKNNLLFEEKISLFSHIINNYINVNSNRVEIDRAGNPMPSIEVSKKTIDLVQDAKYIYSSFRQIGINLFKEQGKLSWEEFQALLESLPEDTIMSKIIQIRQWTPTKGEDANYREQMRKLQRKYSLENNV